MRSFHWGKILLVSSLLLTTIGAGDSFAQHPASSRLPALVLWAWERPEDLRFLPSGMGVAYLASTFELRGGTIMERPRMNPLLVPSGVRMLAVIRIESDGLTIPPGLIPQLANMISARAAAPQVEGVQIDFDARRSQRESFRALLRELRWRLPASHSLSITALASWCQGDDWLRGLPIDFAVPMLFRLGPERELFRDAAAKGHIFREPLCRYATGLSTDEPLSEPQTTSTFWFSPTPWTAAQYRHLGQAK